MIEAVKRNTEMKIAKIFIENSFSEEQLFTLNEIASTLFVREKEFESFKSLLFIDVQSNYRVSPELYTKIVEWRKKHEENKDQIKDTIKEYKKLFESIQESYNYTEVFNDFKPLIYKLHWAFLPVYEDYMINNRGVNPEDDINDYYDHFHSLQDLYKTIDASKSSWKTLKGDINLNHIFKFPIYTNRWGHEDVYKVIRTYNGWSVANIGISGVCDTYGKGLNDSRGGFVANFNQDYVQYPESFHFMINRLWELADESEMSIEELQAKLLNIANLISEVEKTIDKFTPNWYR